LRTRRTWTSDDPDDPSFSSDIALLDPNPDILRWRSSDLDYILGDYTESLMSERLCVTVEADRSGLISV